MLCARCLLLASQSSVRRQAVAKVVAARVACLRKIKEKEVSQSQLEIRERQFAEPAAKGACLMSVLNTVFVDASGELTALSSVCIFLVIMLVASAPNLYMYWHAATPASKNSDAKKKGKS